jgi:hypothetical protein
VLQALMVLDQPLEDEIEENEEKNDGLGRLHIRHLLQMVLQDAQTRLFFKAQAVIQSDIREHLADARRVRIHFYLKSPELPFFFTRVHATYRESIKT